MSEVHVTFATEQGVDTLIAIINAQTLWRGMTRVQRRYLIDDPAQGAPKATLRALLARQLINAEGARTDWGRFVVEVNAPSKNDRPKESNDV